MENKETDSNLSTQKVLTPAHDPGWNDPPKWAFSGAQSATVTPTKRLLNKRVPFPLSSTQLTNKESTSQTSPMSMNMPPPIQSPINLTTLPHPPATPPSDNLINPGNNMIEIDKEQALDNALCNFQDVIDECVHEKSRAEEIQKRLEIMKSAWQDDKLNSSVHQKILDLSKALRDKNVKEADEIHIGLMMNHASLCSSWISGVRHIILGLKAKLEESSSMDAQESQPQLLLVTGKEKD